MEPVVPEFDPLTEARRFHAEAMMDYLSSPNRPGRLVLNLATANYRNALAEYHDIGVNDLAVIPEEKTLYYMEFESSMSSRDNHDKKISVDFTKLAAGLGVAGFTIKRLMEGDLYFGPGTTVASLFLGYALWPTKQEETQYTSIPECDDLDDPFELTHKVLTSPTHFFKHIIVKDDGTKVELVNYRRIARRRLLSNKRRFISAAIGPT